MLPAIQLLGPIPSWEEAQAAQLDTVLARWAQAAREALPDWRPDPQQHNSAGEGYQQQGAAPRTTPGGRRATESPLDSMWLGLKVLLQSMQPPGGAAAAAGALTSAAAAAGARVGGGLGAAGGCTAAPVLEAAVDFIPDLPAVLVAHVVGWRRHAAAAAAARGDTPGGSWEVPGSFRHLLGCLAPLVRWLGPGELACACAGVGGLAGLAVALADAAGSTRDASLHKVSTA